MLAPLAQETGHVGEADLAEILGKCGRLAYILPACKPFVASLLGALAGSKAAASHGSLVNWRGARSGPAGGTPAGTSQPSTTTWPTHSPD